ncbi:hypothetical protein [Photorhabdus viridis]
MKIFIADEQKAERERLHSTQGTKLAYGWMCKGQKTAVKTMGNRTRLNLADISKTGDASMTVSIVNYIAESFIAIRETYPVSHKVHIILDRVSYYRSELVKDWAYVMNEKVRNK